MNEKSPLFASEQPQQLVVGQPMPMPPMAMGMESRMGQPSPFTLPVQIGTNEDIVVRPMQKFFFIIAAFEIVFALILLVAFIPLYLTTKVAVVFVGPVICLLVGIMMLGIANSGVTVFDKVKREVRYTERMALCFCCPKTVTIPFSHIGGARLDAATFRSNGSYLGKVVIDNTLLPSVKIAVQQGNYLELVNAPDAWNAYLRSLAGTSSPAVVGSVYV